tara:strand:- start:118 stop:738 length:621 start_codon:yes stop_codon:yes gene_type:complete
MTIEYRDPIDGEALLSLSQAETDEMGKMLYDVRKHNLAGKIVAGKPKYPLLENAMSECKGTSKLDDVFLIRAFDGDKCVGFRFISPGKYSPIVEPRNAKEEAKYGHIRDWWLSQGLNISECLAPGFYSGHKDYAGQGIVSTIRNLCNVESKKRGYVWIAGHGLEDKSRWDWTMHYYQKNNIEVVLSDIDCPNEYGGYGKIYYYKLV